MSDSHVMCKRAFTEAYRSPANAFTFEKYESRFTMDCLF